MSEPMKTPNHEPEGRLRRGAQKILRWGERVFAVIGLCLVLYHLCFDLSVVVSPSMAPTLAGTTWQNGDWILSERVSQCLRKPRRWEVVSFQAKDGLRVMKRVVGYPGETLQIKEGRVLIDGAPLSRPQALSSLYYYAYGNAYHGSKVPCGDGYYVLGDNSRDSNDSRFEGPLDPSRVRGRAWLCVWPLHRIGFVNP